MSSHLRCTLKIKSALDTSSEEAEEKVLQSTSLEIGTSGSSSSYLSNLSAQIRVLQKETNSLLTQHLEKSSKSSSSAADLDKKIEEALEDDDDGEEEEEQQQPPLAKKPRS